MSDIITPEAPAPAPEAAPVIEPTGYLSPTGEFGEGVPDNIQALLDKKQWKTVDDIVDGFVNLEKFNGGGEHIRIPDTEDAAGWNDVYTKLGKPEAADNYAVNYEGDIGISDELTSQFKGFAHNLNLSQTQFDKVVNFQLDAVQGQEEAMKEQNIAQLKRDFGETTYESKMQESLTVAEKHGMLEGIEAEGLGSSPAVIKLLQMVAGMDAEDTIAPVNPAITGQKTPQDELGDLMQTDAFTDKFNPKHKDTMKRFMELNMTIANSGQGRAIR
jgi:hypothetical protein